MTINLDSMWDTLKLHGVQEQTLAIVTSINGYSEQTLLDVLYAHTGLRSWDQLEEAEEESDS